MLEQGPDFCRWFDTTQFSYIPLCSPITCKDVFNPKVTTFQPNFAEGLHFSAFHYIGLEGYARADPRLTVGGGGAKYTARVSARNFMCYAHF